MSEEKKFFKSAFSVDPVIFGFDKGDLKVLLIKRGVQPFIGQWALPGDLVYPNEDLDSAAGRVLGELTGLKDVYLEQVHTFGAVNRHPLGRVITIAYYSLIKIDNFEFTPSSLASHVEWHDISTINELAFDHLSILKTCFDKLKWKIRSYPVGFELLPKKFTLTELQKVYEAISEKELDKRNFRKKLLSTKLLTDLNESQKGVSHRPAKLYSFNTSKYEQLQSQGYNFEI